MRLIYVKKNGHDVWILKWDAVSFCKSKCFAVLWSTSSSNALPWLIHYKCSLRNVLILGEMLNMRACCKYGQKVIGVFRWAYCEDGMLIKNLHTWHDLEIVDSQLSNLRFHFSFFFFYLNSWIPHFLLPSMSGEDNSFVLWQYAKGTKKKRNWVCFPLGQFWCTWIKFVKSKTSIRPGLYEKSELILKTRCRVLKEISWR